MSSAFWKKGLAGEETTQQEGNTLDCIFEVSALYFTALALALVFHIHKHLADLPHCSKEGRWLIHINLQKIAPFY